ncbi:hypothetical protein K0M31_011298 [Melipona bicolor]|uniref:Uncharacterized protein n=1 Tax=Melipona bicolor TaxID=60889 RepID=A0AA40KUN0_9HYME|nr:hypothetical protein K0M31_011298 [Melipona bicolor]
MVSGWCPCVPIGRRESPAQQQSAASSSRSFGTDGAPFTVSAATDRAEMVQMFYYENRGKCCKKLLRYNGYPNKEVRQRKRRGRERFQVSENPRGNKSIRYLNSHYADVAWRQGEGGWEGW